MSLLMQLFLVAYISGFLLGIMPGLIWSISKILKEVEENDKG